MPGSMGSLSLTVVSSYFRTSRSFSPLALIESARESIVEPSCTSLSAIRF